MVICLEPGTNNLHMVWLMPLPARNLLQFLKSRMLLASGASLPGCLGKEAIKRVFVLFILRNISAQAGSPATKLIGIIAAGFYRPDTFLLPKQQCQRKERTQQH